MEGAAGLSGTESNRPAADGSGIPAILLAALAIALLLLAGLVTRQVVYGDLNVIHGLLSLFFSTNLVICYWEACLFLKRDYIETRTDYWRRWQSETGRTPAIEFLSARVPLRRALSPTVWADVWATYSQFDGSFADRRTFGFSGDVANGFFTPVPTLVLYATYTTGFLPAVVAGIIGVMLFWQWVYVTSGYWVSFFVAGRHKQLGTLEAVLHVHLANSLWVLVPLVGMYVSVRLILDGNYAVLGLD